MDNATLNGELEVDSVDQRTMSESKEDRFRRLAELRINALLTKVRILGNLANRNIYSFNPSQVDLMFASIERALAKEKAKFSATAKVSSERFTF